MKLKQFYLTEKELAKLRKEAEELGITVSELIRRILDEHIQRRS